RGEGVAEGDAGARRRLSREAVDVAQPAHRLGHGGEARTLRIRARLAVAGDPREDEALVHLREAVVAEIPALERAGTEVLGEDVCDTDELEQELLPPRLAEVERDAFLVSRHDWPQ